MKLVETSDRSHFYEYNNKSIEISYGSLFKLSRQKDIMGLIFEYLLLSTTRADRNSLRLTNKKFSSLVDEIDPYAIIKDIFSNTKIETISKVIIFGKLEHYPTKLTTILDTKFLLNENANYDSVSFQNFKKECLHNYPVDLCDIKKTKEVKKLISIMEKGLDYLKKNSLQFENLINEKNKELSLFFNTIYDDVSSLFKIYPNLHVKVSEENFVFMSFALDYQSLIIILLKYANQTALDNNWYRIVQRSINILILFRYALAEKYQNTFKQLDHPNTRSIDRALMEITQCDLFGLASKYNLDSLKEKLFDSEGFLLYCFHKYPGKLHEDLV